MKRELSLLLFLCYFNLVYSLNIHWNSEPVVIKNGLNNNTINSICYDKKGFIWLSTNNGIARYDGFRFRDYPLIAQIDPFSNPLPQIAETLKESANGLFYIQLQQGGIACFDKEKEEYLPFKFDKAFALRDIQSFCWNGNDWYLATSHGMYQAKVTRENENGQDYVFCVLDPKPLIEGDITDLCTDGKTSLYFSINKKKIVCYNLQTSHTSLINEYDRVNRFFLLDGYLWICRLWNDVICYNLKEHKERIISIGNIDDIDFSNPYITGITCKDKQTFYITTWNGLFRLNFTSKNLCESAFSLTPLTQDGGDISSYIERKMTSSFWDKEQKILWVSTFGGGVVKFDVSDNMYVRLQQEFHSQITNMVEDIKGYIWLVKSDGSIMKSTTPSLSSTTRFEVWKNFSSVSSDRYNIYKDKNVYIWLGNNYGEVICINPLSDEMEMFHLTTDDGKILSVQIYQLCMDSRNSLWAATSDGLIQVNPQNHKCRKVEPEIGTIKAVYTVVDDKEGYIWIGTDKGVKRLIYSDERIHWEEGFERENGLEETPVRTIYVNNSDQIYIAYPNLIACINGRKKNKLESVYTLQNSLTSGHVVCIIDDQLGNTWAGNNTGIMAIKNGQKTFYNYLITGSCNAVCRLKDGRLLWANSYGLMFFDPTILKADKTKKQLMLTDIAVNGERILAKQERNGQVILSTSPETQQDLVFNVDNNNFRLFFSDLSYGMIQRKIAYRLLPKNKEWEIKMFEEGLWYNRLPTGKYTLQVKVIYPDATEGEMVQIPILIKSNWYQTKWAYFSYGLLFLIFIYLLYRRIEKKYLRKQTLREREIQMKEKLNQEKREQEHKQILKAMRDRLFALFVLELRTPLSLVIGPLKDILKDQSSNPNFADHSQIAYRNALCILNDCNQLLTIYSHDALNAQLTVAPYLVEKIIDSSLSDIRELLKASSVHFQYEKRMKKDIILYANKKYMHFIIHNLLTNAFSHVNYAGNVSLTLCETVQENEYCLTIIVEDEGKVKIQTVEQLMDENDLLINDLTSTEIGFLMVQKVVEMHHGTVSLESSEEKGTKVTVNLPLDKSIFENDPNIRLVEPKKIVESEPIDFEAEKPMVEDIVSPPPTTNTKKTLLIVEDHKDLRFYLKVLFNKEYNLLMAVNGQEGVDIAKKELPDLIICDVMMPLKDGLECCREIKEGLDTCSIPFIILTARVEEDDIIRGLEVGADDYILKPFVPTILQIKVRNLINSRQTLKQMYTKLLMLPEVNSMDKNESKQIKEENIEDPFISSVIKIIEENIGKSDFSVKKLSAEMNMSQPTLYRKVKKNTDYTIVELIRGVRLRHAAVLLKTKEYGVQEVAEMVGYNDIPTFRKHFTDAFGTTPSTYE